ncbi:hypothetical protein D3C71_1813200 [compost metagenome]
MRFPQAGEYFQATAARHIQVQQQYIAFNVAKHLPQFRVSTRFSGDLDVWRIGQCVAYSSS